MKQTQLARRYGLFGLGLLLNAFGGQPGQVDPAEAAQPAPDLNSNTLLTAVPDKPGSDPPRQYCPG